MTVRKVQSITLLDHLRGSSRAIFSLIDARIPSH